MLTFRNPVQKRIAKETKANNTQFIVEYCAMRMDNTRVLMDIVDAIREDHARRTPVRNQLDEMAMKLNDEHCAFFNMLCDNAWWNK